MKIIVKYKNVLKTYNTRNNIIDNVNIKKLKRCLDINSNFKMKL